MRALSIRQPYIEQILRGVKTTEIRGRTCHILGERFYLYASTIPGPRASFRRLGLEPGDLPTGLLLGTAIITHVIRDRDQYLWHIAEPRRLKRPRKPTRRPQPGWFNPF